VRYSSNDTNEKTRIYLESLQRNMVAAQRQIEWSRRLIEESREVWRKVSDQLARTKRDRGSSQLEFGR
jgi:hypothetical protein